MHLPQPTKLTCQPTDPKKGWTNKTSLSPRKMMQQQGAFSKNMSAKQIDRPEPRNFLFRKASNHFCLAGLVGRRLERVPTAGMQRQLMLQASARFGSHPVLRLVFFPWSSGFPQVVLAGDVRAEGFPFFLEKSQLPSSLRCLSCCKMQTTGTPRWRQPYVQPEGSPAPCAGLEHHLFVP